MSVGGRLRILIHLNTMGERGYQESVSKLEHFGYEVVTSLIVPDENYDYVIDKRSPEWRGWRSALANIEWRHYDKVVEWNRQVNLDKYPSCSVYSGGDDDCPT